ncbi:hypothetical protein ACJJTC_006934 [Scirpophaga incertulas]
MADYLEDGMHDGSSKTTDFFNEKTDTVDLLNENQDYVVNETANHENKENTTQFQEISNMRMNISPRRKRHRRPENWKRNITKKLREAELQEAGKSLKEAMSSLNKVLNKPVVPEDDFDRYGKILANKLRKLSESDSLKIMYEIDGLFIKRMNATPSYFTRPSPTYCSHSEPTQRLLLHSTTSPTYYVRPESASPPTAIVNQAFYDA